MTTNPSYVFKEVAENVEEFAKTEQHYGDTITIGDEAVPRLRIAEVHAGSDGAVYQMEGSKKLLYTTVIQLQGMFDRAITKGAKENKIQDGHYAITTTNISTPARTINTSKEDADCILQEDFYPQFVQLVNSKVESLKDIAPQEFIEDSEINTQLGIRNTMLAEMVRHGVKVSNTVESNNIDKWSGTLEQADTLNQFIEDNPDNFLVYEVKELDPSKSGAAFMWTDVETGQQQAFFIRATQVDQDAPKDVMHWEFGFGNYKGAIKEKVDETFEVIAQAQARPDYRAPVLGA